MTPTTPFLDPHPTSPHAPTGELNTIRTRGDPKPPCWRWSTPVCGPSSPMRETRLGRCVTLMSAWSVEGWG